MHRSVELAREGSRTPEPNGPRGFTAHVAIVYDSQSGNGIVRVGSHLATHAPICAQDAAPMPDSLSTSDGYVDPRARRAAALGHAGCNHFDTHVVR